ncbi:hypothetical protein L1049_001302 [Liquidambar formosana]|uniref:Amino acid permease/ SLC12A domain-containing protein n=1 Tax=Liquidambar formosana TaxID=63359 RepID=A0AAP0NCL1_LIQFO
MTVGNDTDEGIRRRGCSCTKNDFLPEESFQSWGNYARALKATPARLKDRMLTRSLDATELHEVKARSQHEMKKTLSWWDLMWFNIGAVIGTGIFVLTGLEAREHAGPAVVLSYVVTGVSAMLSVFCYTEFAVEIPVAAAKGKKRKKERKKRRRGEEERRGRTSRRRYLTPSKKMEVLKKKKPPPIDLTSRGRKEKKKEEEEERRGEGERRGRTSVAVAVLPSPSSVGGGSGVGEGVGES